MFGPCFLKIRRARRFRRRDLKSVEIIDLEVRMGLTLRDAARKRAF
jgi:hypothetical protein